MSFTVSYATKVLAQQHAMQSCPAQAFGVIIDGRYVPLEVSCLENAAMAAERLNAQALFFSKPEQGGYPDQYEMSLQIEAGIPFGVSGGSGVEMSLPAFWGNDVEMEPLIGRSFVHGIWDCYSLVRDAFKLGNEGMQKQGMEWSHGSVTLPNVPRDDGWWSKDQDLYMDWLKPAGFVEISAGAARPGDGFLMKIRSEKLNHAGVLVSDNAILHHLPTRLSRREIGGLWFTQIDKWVRYRGA